MKYYRMYKNKLRSKFLPRSILLMHIAHLKQNWESLFPGHYFEVDTIDSN